MATIRKKNGLWQVQIRRKGYRTLSRSFTYKDWALRWAKETERELELGTVPAAISDLKRIIFGDLLSRYLEEITPTKRGAESERYRLSRFLRHSISSLSLDRLTPQVLAAYRDERLREVCGASVRREMTILHHCLEIARREWGIPLSQNPVEGLRLPPHSPSRVRRLAPGELERLLSAAETKVWYLAPIIRFALATGMRRGEILSLKWSDIDLERRLAFLRLTKNGQSRVVPLAPDAISVLRHIPKNEDQVFPVSPNAVRLSWERLCRLTGMEDLHFHDLRHEAISGLFESGIILPEIAQISGHRDIRSLLRYAHPNPSSFPHS